MSGRRLDLKAIFAEALDRPAGPERAAYLDGACGGDAAARGRVDELLAALEHASDVLGRSAREESVDATTLKGEILAAPASEPTGTVNADATTDDHAANGQGDGLAPGASVRYFGDYEVRRELGRGGMGVVYEARQVSLNRRVALKMVRAGLLAGNDELRRFRNEAEAVALLDHPGVVSVYEVGDHDGQHYFSMKLVEGGSLVPLLARYKDDPKASARLVAEAAEAVAHAHARGILHRDLKPANILVDAEGRPHVTDFGLARRVEEDQGMTLSGAILGTPAYMSPEQAAGRRGGITTATDVYGLGAVLYALMTGQAPFGGDSVVATLDAVRTAPPEPPTRLNGRIPRDLETICLKCLEKDPRRRYATAQALADDLRAWLDSRPIAARRVGPVERAWLWCRRRPAVATLGVGLALAVIAGVAGMAWQWRVAVVQRDTSDAIRRFLIEGLLAEAAPERNERSRNVTLLEVFDRAAARVDGAFPRQPEVEAEVRLMIGQVYQQLGEAARAVPHLERSREIFGRLDGVGSVRALSAVNDLAVALLRLNRLDEAEAAFRRVLDCHRRNLGDGAKKTLVTMSNLGDLLRVTGKVEEAETLLRSASSGLGRLAGPSDLATLRATGNLAVLLHSIGRLDEAEPLYRGVIVALRGLGKTRHPDFLSILNNYAMLLQEHDDPDEAEATFREVLAARRQVQGSGHPDTLMSANNLADLLGKIGKVTEAEALWAEVLGRLEQTADRGARSIAGAFAHANLGELLAGRGEREKAREHYRASLEILKATFDADHPLPREIQARLDALPASGDGSPPS